MGYPTSAFSPAARSNGGTIDAAHVNDLQTEVTAIVAALLGTITHPVTFGGAVTLPTLTQNLRFTDATHDIGASGATRPRDLFLSRNAVIGGTLGVTGALSPLALLDVSGAAAGQVKFPATQNASANANTLDDYEEGTWVPVIGGSGGQSGQTYSQQSGTYTKVGRLVTVEAFVALSVEGTITGTVQIQGLPFGAGSYSAVSLMYSGLATNWVNVMGLLGAGGTYLSVSGAQAATTTNRTDLSAVDTGNATAFFFSATYSV